MTLIGRAWRSWSCTASVLLTLLIHFLTHRSACAIASPPAVSSNATRPAIRIALLIDEFGSATVARFLLDQFSTGNRTLLPDFDLMIDTWKIRPAADEAPVALVAMLSDDTPTYHAIVGPWNRQDTFDLVPAVGRARVLNVHFSNSPLLSDRTSYPYTFRVTRSLKGEQSVIFHIVYMNDWRRIISLWQQQDVYDTANEVASLKQITNYPTLVDRNAAEWAVSAWQGAIVAFIRASRIRILIMHIDQTTGWQLICRVHRARLSSIQYFREETWAPSWFMDAYPPALGDCTGDEMYIAAGGSIFAFHTPAASGVNVLGVQTPAVGGLDESHVPLTCFPSLTAHSFFNNGDLLLAALKDGLISVNGTGEASFFVALAGVIHDGVCATLLSLHDAIYGKGIPPSAIEARQGWAFEELMKSMSQVDFRGPSGHFRFYNKSGDARFIFHLLGQEAISGRRNDTLQVVAFVTFPDGVDESSPVISVVNESVPLIWRDGSTGLGPKPHLAYFPDCAENQGVLVWDSCQPCSPGSAFDSLLQACRTCPLGSFQDRSGMSFCDTAPPGWYVIDIESPSTIAPCPEGHECPQAGTVLPQPCPPGRFADVPGKAACEFCPAGQYQNSSGSEFCMSCSGVLIGGVTATMASTSASECICPEGTFKEVGRGFCSACLEGMRCPEGSDMLHLTLPSFAAGKSAAPLPFPLVEPGHMTLQSAPLTVYRCEDERHCPGGRPGSCASLRDPSSVACGRCMDGTYDSGYGCVSCGNTGGLPFLCVCGGGLVAAVVVTVLINNEMHKVTAASMMAMTVTSLLVTGIQTMGVFTTMDIPWENPVKRVMELSKVMSFDLEVLKVACVMGVNPLRAFALRQLFAVIFVPLVWLTLVLKKYALKCGQPKTDIGVELCNALGTLYTVFFISILLSAIDPFICYKHPGNSGESVRSAPSLLCFEGREHPTMMIIGIAALILIPLPFSCLCAYGIAMYPRKIKKHSSSKFLHAMRFLFLRYAPNRYYFQLFALARSLLLCLIPAIFRDEIPAQVLLLTAVLCLYMFVADNLRPWRARVCNPLDAMICVLFVILLLCGALFLDEAPHRGTMAVLSFSALMLVLVSAVVTLGYAAWQYFAPAYFQFFICHHKAHAAAQSRYLKIVLQKKCGKVPVFIDSDNLQELDALFDIIKSRVRHLLAFLTADTLTRPWCVGEIVTALRTSIPVTRLQTRSFIAPTEQQCARPESFVDKSAGCNLSEYGIQWSDVAWALKALLSAKTDRLDLPDTLPGTQRFEKAIALFLKERVADRRVPCLDEVKAGGVLVVTHAESDEAIAAGGILVDHIAPRVYRLCEQGVTLLCNYESNLDLALRAARHAAVNVIILTPGCLESSVHLRIIMAVMMAQKRESAAPAIISVNTSEFRFPSALEIEELCNEGGSLDLASRDVVIHWLSLFFRRISIPFPSSAAQHILDSQSDEVYRRIKGGLNPRWKSGPGTAREGSFMFSPPPSRDSLTAFSSSHGLDTGTTSMFSRSFGLSSPAPSAFDAMMALQPCVEEVEDTDRVKVQSPRAGYRWCVEFD